MEKETLKALEKGKTKKTTKKTETNQTEGTFSKFVEAVIANTENKKELEADTILKDVLIDADMIKFNINGLCTLLNINTKQVYIIEHDTLKSIFKILANDFQNNTFYKLK